MAALLTSVGDAKDKLAVYLNECRRMGLKVLPPDVGESIRYFAAVGEDIRFGLGAVRNVGTNVVDSIVVSRQDADFESFHDFLSKVPVHVANKRTVRISHQGGSLRLARLDARALMEIHEDATEAAVEVKRKAATGAIGFDFDSLYDETESRCR
jgi:DNA polymerase-3 subunit alpha